MFETCLYIKQSRCKNKTYGKMQEWIMAVVDGMPCDEWSVNLWEWIISIPFSEVFFLWAILKKKNILVS